MRGSSSRSRQGSRQASSQSKGRPSSRVAFADDVVGSPSHSLRRSGSRAASAESRASSQEQQLQQYQQQQQPKSGEEQMVLRGPGRGGTTESEWDDSRPTTAGTVLSTRTMTPAQQFREKMRAMTPAERIMRRLEWRWEKVRISERSREAHAR